jgi:HlyD family secretion protein
LNRRFVLIAILAAVAAGAAYFAWRQSSQEALPKGIASANGRIEATRIEIATKFPGELLEVRVEEGDMVKAGQVLAVMETDEIQAARQSASADLRRQENLKKEAEAEAKRLDGEIAFARSELDRARSLFDKGYIPKDKLEARATTLSSVLAARQAAGANIDAATAAIDMAIAEIKRLDSILEHGELKAPRDARVQYRLAEPGEILIAGGRVLTLIDLSDSYMTVFLPAVLAGRLAIGADARIVVDAADQWVFPAKVSFVAPDAQFTPKSVETQSEREKLMFRVKLTVDPAIALKFEDRIKPGMRGLAYVATATTAVWPERLAVRMPP